MYIEAVANRGSPPAILLRESYREGGRVKKRTLLNLSGWPPERIAGFKALLKGGRVVAADTPAAITIRRSLPHGHVAAALGTARKIGLDRLLGPAGNRCRDLVLALTVARLLDPGSKLAAARALSPATAASSLGGELGLGAVDEEELYRALRSSMACCARPMAARSRSRCLTATPPIPPPSAPRSKSSKSALASTMWFWSAIAA